MAEPIELGFRSSPQQRRVWRLQNDGLTSCASLCALRIEGDLDRRAFRRALAETVARHEILRTAFRLPAGMTVPLQVILKPGPVHLPVVDIRGIPLEACAPGLLLALGRPPFDLERGTGWRAALVWIGPCEHELLLVLSAACADAGAFEPLIAGLLMAYARQKGGGDEDSGSPLQYADVAEWQNSLLEGEDTAEGVATWREHWREHGLDAQLALPLPLEERQAAPGPFAPREEPLFLPRDTTGALADLAAAWGCPLQVLILTAWIAVIQRGTGRDETLVGVLYPGRDHEELRDVIGPLARYLPLVARFSPTASLREAVEGIRQAMAEAEPWGDYFSWDHVAGNGPGGFPVCFEAAAEGSQLAIDGLRVSPGQLARNLAVIDSFALALACHRAGEDLRLTLRYDPRRFRREAIHRLSGRLAVLLGSIAARPGSSLADHPAVAADELSHWLELSVAPPSARRDREGTTLHAAFAEQASRAPGRRAVVAGDAELTFRELDERANRLAHHLRAAGAGPEVPVALCLERSAEAVVALLAVWKAGAAYVPLDPTQPAERLAYLLADLEAPLLVTSRGLASRLPAELLPGVRTLRLEEEAAEIARRPADPPRAEAGPRNLAYLIYTSGSTGRPKGVQVEHRSALHLLTALEAAVLTPLEESGLRPDPLLASLNAPLIFDASVQQLVLLLAGHTLCIVPEDVRADGAALLGFLQEQRIDLLDCTPSQLRLLVNEGLLDSPAGPRIVLTAGEAVDEPLWRRLAQAERKVVFNLYGPTECTVDATFHRIEQGSDRPTIGRPLAGYEVFLLDRVLQPVPPGAPGEICLGGAGLARGYLRRPELTAERFVPHAFARTAGERLYRTGDLARHLPDGGLEFLGRLDHQVKIRGFRIELGEIEAVLGEQAGVREAVVAARDSAAGDRRLVAYVVGDSAAVSEGALRRALRERLPDYMVPTAFVMLPALPLTPNGKVDRKALPAPERQGSGETYLAPRTPVEEVLAGIWAEVLGLERVGVADQFFDLGGHSLLATQVMSRLRSVFSVEMPLRDLFTAPRLADLAARVESVRRTGPASSAPPLLPVPREGTLPLSYAQQRLWFIDQLEPGSPLYNLPSALRVEGPLDIAVLAACLSEIVRRHEALRTVFAAPRGTPVQVIQPAAPFVLPLVDLSSLPGPSEQALALAREEAGRPFDLARGPLLRGLLLRLGESDHVVALTLHHIVSDGWSTGVLVQEIAALYPAFLAGRPSPLPELPVQYADFALWQRGWLLGEILENEIAWWRRQLAGLPPLLELPTDRPRPAVPSYRGATRPVRLPAGLTRRLEALARREGATLFMVLLAGFQTLLARTSGQDDLAVGSPIAGRNRSEVESLIGFFINTLVLRGDLSGEPSFRQLLGRVRETALAAYMHQDVPFEKLVEDLAPERSLAHTPLFQVVLVLQNAPFGSLEVRDLRLRPVGVEGTTAKFDLTVVLAEDGGGLSGTVEHATDLHDGTSIERLFAGFERLLAAAADGPDARVAELPLLGEAERHQLLEWGAIREEHAADSTLHGRFAERARRAPEAPALACGGVTLTYAELHRRSNQLARWLRGQGAGPESRVGLRLDRSVDLVVGVLGVLQSGAAYVPLDPGAPRERLAFVLDDAEIRIVVGEDEIERAKSLPAGDLEPLGDASSLAYVIYTSGSTGRPKGTLITHANVTRLFDATAGWFGFGERDVWTLFHSYTFDFSVWELWGALLHGGRLVIVPWEVSRSPELFLDLLVRERVTVLNQTPSAFAQLAQADAERGGVTTDLRLVIFGGEALDPAGLEPWFARHGDAQPRLVNMYGITETTVHVTYRPLSVADARGGHRSVIGVPIADLSLAVVDRTLSPAPIGVPGELVVGGAGLARGYLGRPELTAERFVPDRFGARLYRSGDLGRFLPNGDLEYLGRLDHQVKIRGFRIELGEIEAVLSALPGVRQAVVLVREDRPGDRRLVAYITGDATVPALRDALRERLPDYMVPAAFVVLEALPLTVNGKVDRRALSSQKAAPEQTGGEEEPLAPRTPTEELLAGIWAEVLGLDAVGADDDFFDLGGHSLLATQVMARLRGAFGVEMPLREFFEAPRLSELAARIETARRAGTGPPAPPLAPIDPALRRGLLPLSFAQQRLWFIDQLEPGSPLYNIPVALRVAGPLDVAVLARCLGEIVRRHEVLRTVFAAAKGVPVQAIQPPRPFPLPVVDLAGLPESAREALSVTLTREEAVRPFDLGHGPLLRGVLLRLAAEDHAAALTMHHIVSDGWSIGILVREVTALYTAFAEGGTSPLPDLPIQYADFAVWQRGWLDREALEGLAAYWRQRLAGAPPQLDLPGARPRPAAPSPHGAARQRRFSPPLLEDLRALGRRESATLFMTLLASLQALLFSRTGGADLVVGTDVAGRDRSESEGLIGFFINQLPLRADLTGDPTLRELLGRVRETALEAYAHQDMPFDHLVEALHAEQSLRLSPVFQVKLVLQPAPRESLELPGLSWQVVDPPTETAQLDLHWSFLEKGDELWLTLTYSTDLYDEPLIDELLGHYEIWLRAFVERPEARLGGVAAELAQAEQDRLAERGLEVKSKNLGKLRSQRGRRQS